MILRKALHQRLSAAGAAFLAVALVVTALPLPVQAATGDISAVRILSNGWMAEIDIDGFKDGGAYDFGLGANNDPVNAKIAFTVTSEGYDANGTLGTVTRTVYGTQYIRKAYPDEAQKDEVEDVSKVTLKVALSDFVYNDDENGGAGTSGTDVTVAIGSGFYTDSGSGGGGTGNASTSALTVTNNSTLDYPKVIGRWAWPGYERVTGDFLVEATTFHRFARNGKPVAAVKFTASDQSGNSAATQTVTEMTKTTRSGDANQVLVYAATIPVASLDQGEVVDVNFQAYPWVGDADSVLNSATTSDGTTQPDERLGPLHQLNDKSSTYGVGYALVSPSGVTNGTVYSSQGAAEAGTAFLTIEKAAEGLRTYHNANHARDTAGGGVILLAEGSYMFPGAAVADLGTSMDAWMIVKPASTAAKANTIISGGSNVQFRAPRLKIEGLTLSTTTSTNTLRGRTTTDVLWLHNNTIAMTQTAPIYSYKAVYTTQNTITALSNGLTNFSTNKSPYALIRGNTSTPILTGGLYAILGNRNIQPLFSEYNQGAGHQVSNNSIFAFNTIYSFSSAINLALTSENDNNVAVVQNILESLSATQPILQIAADNSTSTANNILVWHNTLTGQRANLAYNDSGTVGRDRLNWSQRFNSLNDWNNKDDTFGTPNANRTGSWPVGYNVGTIGTLSEQANFPGEFGGIFTDYSSAPAYTDDNSGSGGIGNGTYTLTATSQGVDFATTTAQIEQPLPFDFAGNAFYGPPDSGAYEYQPPYDMGDDEVSTSTIVRVYGDEKFRNKTTPSAGGTADLSISIPGSDTAKWLDVSIATWDLVGDLQKTWTESTSRTDVTNTVHVVGDLTPSAYYAVQVDGVTGTSISGAGCTAGICLANGSGEITFTYTGSYSSHTFNIIEGSDTVAPVISSIASSTAATTATITWTTDEAATSTVSYGATSSYGTASTSASLVTSHSLTLTGLTPATLYHFQVGSADASGNVATSSDLTFTTDAVVDTTAPIISSTSSGTPSDTSATITWTTDEAATSTVNYGLTASYGTASSSAVSATSHSTTLTGLAAATTYHYQISVWDDNGNNATSSDLTFTTDAEDEEEEEEVSSGGGGRNWPDEEDATPEEARDLVAALVAANRDLFLWARAQGLTLPESVLTALGDTASTTPRFARDLFLESSGPDVKLLQQLLNAHGFVLALSGPGSTRQETDYFGLLTQAAVIAFQKRYAVEPALGYFGTKTRAMLDSLGWTL